MRGRAVIPTRLEIAAVLVFALLCGTLGYWLATTDAPVIEDVSAKPELRQTDGSVIAARHPDAKPPPAPHKIPKGVKETRRVAVTVKPSQPDCDPVDLTLSLVEQDGGQRVIASAANGLVLSALDTPIVPALVSPPRRPWAAGVAYDPIQRRAGAWIERDIARLRVGADVMQSETGELRALLRVGWRF